MAFHFGGDRDDEMLAEINVTPLVDVMLVLLIIFMIAAPMLHQGIDVALPQAQATNLAPRPEDSLILSIKKDGMVYLQDTPIHTSQLEERLLPLLAAREETFLYLKGDREVPYGRVVEVLDLLQQAGIRNLGMVTERPAGSRRRR